MRIRTFSPEMSGIEEKHDLEKKMVHSDVLTSADVKDYANFIIEGLNALKNSSEQEKELFIVDAFSDDKIREKIWDQRMSNNAGEPIELDEDEALSAIGRVRQALVEELKGKIDEKIYLISSDIIRKAGKTTKIIPDAPKKKTGRKNIISEVVDVASGKERIYKDQELFLKEHVGDTAAAFALFERLAPHSNIVNIKEYDQASQRAIFEKLNLQPFDQASFLEEVNKDSFIKCLKVLKDCMEGAAYLAENGLVLQDIKIDNLGVVETEEGGIKGVLFDLEGLVKEGTKMNTRMSGGAKYIAPEAVYGMPRVRPGEMVYQFGVCLQDILKVYENQRIFKISDQSAANKLDVFVDRMINKDPKFRINLLEAKNELADIISKFEVVPPAPQTKKKSFFSWLKLRNSK